MLQTFTQTTFLCIWEKIMPCHLNMAAIKEHVGEIERWVRTVKEVTRCITQTLPFNRISKLTVRSMALASTSRLNNIPALNGVSTTLGLTTIVIGRPASDYNVMNKISFGVYTQINGNPPTTNGKTQRTTGAIALHNVGNKQGG